MADWPPKYNRQKIVRHTHDFDRGLNIHSNERLYVLSAPLALPLSVYDTGQLKLR